MRHRIPFAHGERLTHIEVYTLAEDLKIATHATAGRFVILCTAMRCITTTGRAVQVGDAYDIGAMPGALYAKFARKGPTMINSYIHSVPCDKENWPR